MLRAPLQHQNHRPRGGCGAATGRLRPPAKFAGYGLLRCSAGVPDDLCRGKEVFLVPGKTWQASLTPSEASETFSGVFWSFRGLGNVQRRVLELSEPSETFSGVF